MSSNGVRLTGDWPALRRILSVEQMKGRLEKNIKQATRANAGLAVAAVKKNILKGTYAIGRARNARLTRRIKRGNRPLVDSGQLHRAVAYEILSSTSAEIGIRRSDPRAAQAVINHEGATIRVTPAMRNMFRALAIASNNGENFNAGGLFGRAAALFARMSDGWKPLKDSTTVIRIPPRPFIKEVFENQQISEMFAKNWLVAAMYGVADLRLPANKLKKKLANKSKKKL